MIVARKESKYYPRMCIASLVISTSAEDIDASMQCCWMHKHNRPTKQIQLA